MKFFLKLPAAELMMLLLLGLFFWKLPLETQDGPNHKKVAVILQRLPESPLEAAVYQNNLSPLQTNELFPLLYLGLSRLFLIDTYERVFFIFFILLIPISYYFFLSEFFPPNRSFWVLSLPLCFHPLFIEGMYNFLASVPLTLILFILLKKGLASRKMIYAPLFFLVSWIAFLAHPFPFFVLPLCLGLMVFTARPRPFLTSLPYASTILFFLILGFLLPLSHQRHTEFASPLIFLGWPFLVGDLFIRNFISYSLGQLLWMIPFFVILLGLMFFSLVSVSWKEKGFWVIFLAAYFLFPSESTGGAHLNERYLPFVILFLPVGLSLPPLKIRVVQGVAVLTTLLLVFFLQGGMKKVHGTVLEAQEALRALPSPTRLYPIPFDRHGPGLTYSSIFHLWGVYENSKIVFSPSLFAHSNLMPLSLISPASPTYFPSTSEGFAEMMEENNFCRVSDPVETPDCPRLRQEGFQRIIENASFYDYWFVYRPPKDFVDLLLRTPGLEKISQSGESSLWHFKDAQPFVPNILGIKS